uniref:Uncharacterized protein n=1 Tax=Romanomermis culicivorax TaxID=13658 RepID=A0A915KSZ0_ROMCU
MDLFSVKVKPQIRNESTDVVDQFNLGSVGGGVTNKLNVVKLVESLDNVKNVGELKKQLISKSRDKKATTLDVPLHRQARDKIERSVAYDQSKRKVGFWDEIVRRNRLADKLTFPLRKFESEEGKAPNESSLEGAVARFQSQPRTELEIETAKLLKSSKNYLPPDQEYTEAEKEALNALSIEEAEKRKKELSKIRALISYKTAQNKRQNSIKSKRYHRLMKKQKRKETEKEVLELLRKNDREGAKEKLELLEMDRIAERSTLRHKSTGKWAKQIRNLAKKDPELRQALQDQLKLSRELADKVFAAKNDDKENSDLENSDDDDHNNRIESIKKSSVKIDLTPKIADIVAKNSNDENTRNDQNILISEAFADDDVLEEELKNEMNDDSDDDLGESNFHSLKKYS